MGGHVFEINPMLKFKKTGLFIKRRRRGTFTSRRNSHLLIHDKFTIGGAYCWDAAWSALVGFQVTEGMLIGYSYDSDIKALRNYNNGSHEVFLRFELFK